jgi:hypothetical protein
MFVSRIPHQPFPPGHDCNQAVPERDGSATHHHVYNRAPLSGRYIGIDLITDDTSTLCSKTLRPDVHYGNIIIYITSYQLTASRRFISVD